MSHLNKRQSSYTTGQQSEDYVQSYLLKNSYKIISSRWRNSSKKGTGFGEIDIIAIKNKTIVFIEVKSRSNLDNIFYSITKNQQQRIINSAIIFMSQNPRYKNYDIRFDAIFVLMIGQDKKITHIKNAFDASDISSMIGL